RSEWVPITPTATNNINTKANFTNVQTVFAGRWGDTATALDPALYRGKVAVFTATAAAAGPGRAGPGRGRGGPGGPRARRPRRGANAVLRCDWVPNKCGAEAAARVEAQQRADSIAGRGGRGAGGRGGAGAVRDERAMRVGAVAVLLVALDSNTTRAADSAFR